MSMGMTCWFEFLRHATLIGVLAWTASGVAQGAQNREESPSAESLSASSSDSVRELREQVRELQEAVAGGIWAPAPPTRAAVDGSALVSN